MAHRSQLEYVRDVVALFDARTIASMSVLEVGSRNINGSVRKYLGTARKYIGIDPVAGRDVDIECTAVEYHALYPEDENSFNIIVCCEVLEHDPEWQETLEAINSLVRENGIVILTWASPARPEHGTARTDGNQFSFLPDYYFAPSLDQVLKVVEPSVQNIISQEINDQFKDCYLSYTVKH